MNIVIVSGNLTRDPEMRYTSSGKAVTSFSVAVNEGSGDRKTTEFLDCEAWEKQAELVAEYCRKGRKVLVTGWYTTDHWKDKTTGADRKKVIIKCRNVEFLDRRPEDQLQPQETQPDLSDLSF